MISSKALLDWKGTPPAPFVTQLSLHVAGVCVKRIGEHETTVKISSDLYAEPTLLILFKLIAVIIKSQSTGFTADTSAAPTR
jgi:hypothetical protein